MSDRNQQIDDFLQANLDSYLQDTVRLCAQPSVSATGQGVRECAVLVQAVLREHGFAAEQYETTGNPIIVARAEGQSERTILLYNHYDVQPPEPLELWTTPPFEPTFRDGSLFARGVADDKGHLVCRLAALDALRAVNGGELPCNVIFLTEGEEEIGSPTIAAFVRDHLDLLRCNASIWEVGGVNAEGRPINLLGCRGVLAVQLHVRTLNRDNHSGEAHMYPSAAWRLTWALASLKGPDERIRIPGFYDGAVTASERDLEFFRESYDPLEHEWARETLGVKAFLRGLSGPALDAAVFEPTCNIQGITTGYQGGGMKTIIPAEASAKIDFRLVPGQDPEDILAKLRRHLDAEGFEDVEAQRLGAMLPYRVDPEDPFVQLSARTAEEVYGKPAAQTPLVGGSSPMYAVGRAYDVPIVFAGVGYHDNRAHAPDEHMRLVDFLNGSRHTARIIDGLARL